MLASKLYEAWRFIDKEELLSAAPSELREAGDKVTRFYGHADVEILRFIRDKFGFHYDMYSARSAK